MKRKIWKCLILFFMAAVILSLCSCGSGGEDGTGTIVLNNDSIATIDGFNLAPVDQISWGPNILSGPVFPGERIFIVDIVPGDYDARIRAAGLYSDYFGYLYDIPIDAGDEIRLYAHNSSFSGSLEIRNNSAGTNIIGVYVVPADASTWGVNQASSVIRPSGVLHISDLPPGFYDVKVVWNVGPDSVYYDIKIESLTLVTIEVD